MDNSNYMENVLQTFLLIQSSPDELQVGMVDNFLNNQVIGAFSDLIGAIWWPTMTRRSDWNGNIQMTETTTGMESHSNTNMTTFQALQSLQIPDHSSTI